MCSAAEASLSSSTARAAYSAPSGPNADRLFDAVSSSARSAANDGRGRYSKRGARGLPAPQAAAAVGAASRFDGAHDVLPEAEQLAHAADERGARPHVARRDVAPGELAPARAFEHARVTFE